MSEVLSIQDYILTPFYLIIIYLIAYQVKAKKIKEYPEYKYFVKGLSFKLIGVICFVLVYVFYYGGGDTINYFKGAKALLNLCFENPRIGFSILEGNLTPENYSGFNYNTGYPPWYMWKDPDTFSVCRYSVLALLLGAKSLLPANLIVAYFSYIGVWRLFRLFVLHYPTYTKVLAYSILFIPSFVFWGSGIMKDTYVVGAVCWITYNFYQVLIERKRIVINLFLFLFNFAIIITLKPYIIISLVPGMLFWINSAYLNKIKSSLFRAITLPFLLLLLLGSAYLISSNVGVLLGGYSDLGNVVEKAQVIQEDLLRQEQYGSNSYDIGEIDGSFSGLLKKAPISIFTAIYRPSILEIGSPTMLLSAIENTFLLVFTIIILIKTRLDLLYRLIKENPLILYSLVFSIILAFGVGLATANFGALVRYKIPLIPFYFSALFILREMGKEKVLIRR